MRVSSDGDGIVWVRPKPVTWGSGSEEKWAPSEKGYAYKRLALQRGAIVALEQELKKMMRLRRDVKRTLVLLNEQSYSEARAILSEVLREWPST